MSDFIYEPIRTVEELEQRLRPDNSLKVRFVADFNILLTNGFEENLDYFTECVLAVPGCMLSDFSYALVGVDGAGSAIVEVDGFLERF